MRHSPSRSFLTVAACAACLLLRASRAPAQNPGTDSPRTAVVTAPSPYWGYTYTPYVDRTPLDGVIELRRYQVAVTFRLYKDTSLVKDERNSAEFLQAGGGKWQEIPK